MESDQSMYTVNIVYLSGGNLATNNFSIKTMSISLETEV